MNCTEQDLIAQLEQAAAQAWTTPIKLAEKRHKLPSGLLLALASRETDMRDIVGDRGHGRGLFQIDDGAHLDWLKTQGAGGKGGIPPIAAAALFAGTLVADNLAFAKANGVRPAKRLKFACSAYNAGPGGALTGFTAAGDSDARTTGGDYGADVLERYATIVRLLDTVPVPVPPPPPAMLELGVRSVAVTALKHDLHGWFDRATPGQWATFAVTPGPTFGTNLDTAVREFQSRLGLTRDGQVGSETAGALADAAPAPRPTPMPLFPDLILRTPLKRGSTASQVRLVQGWLGLHDLKLPVTGTFGPATEAQTRAFQELRSLPVTGIVDRTTYAQLVQPMTAALRPLAGGIPLGRLFVAYAREHLAQRPAEVGGPNRGPWVRLYTGGQEGDLVFWCAGFATFCLGQACQTLGIPTPVAVTLSCDELARTAGASLLPAPSALQRSLITPGSIFLRRAKPGSGTTYEHCGIVTQAAATTFATIEGNSNTDGSSNGFEVCAGVHEYPGIDFIPI